MSTSRSGEPGTHRRTRWTSASLPVLSTPRSDSTAPRSVITQSGRGFGPWVAPSQLDQRSPSGGASGWESTANGSLSSPDGRRSVRREVWTSSSLWKALNDKGTPRKKWCGLACPGPSSTCHPPRFRCGARWLRGRPRRSPTREGQRNRISVASEPSLCGNPYHRARPRLYGVRETNRRRSVGGEWGMPSASFGGGAVRVRTPGGYEASPAGDRADRDLGDGTGRAAAKSALLAALGESDFEVVDRIDLAPRRSRDLESPPPANRRGTVSLDVDVAPTDDAVVLLEQDGVYSWHLPLAPTGGTRSLDTRTLTFEIDVQPRRSTSTGARATRRARELTAEQPHDRGLLGHLVHGAVQAIVLRFASPLLGGVVH